MRRERITTSLHKHRGPSLSHPPNPPRVAPVQAQGLVVRTKALTALLTYAQHNHKRHLSLGPHHNRLSQYKGTKREHIERFRRKLDAKKEVLIGALYAEGYDMKEVARRSEELFGVKLSLATIYSAVRRVFGDT